MADPYSLHIKDDGRCHGVFELTLNSKFDSWTPKQTFGFVEWFLNDPLNGRRDGDDYHLIEFVKARRLVRLCKDGHELFASMVLDSGNNDIMAADAG